MRTVSSSPRKQRKRMYTMPIHARRKRLSAHLAGDLIEKYNTRSFPVRTGDVVKILRGSMRGHVGKVVDVDTKKMKIHVEGATITKTDGTQLPMKIDPSNVIITKLDLSDPLRKKRIEKRKKKGGKK